MALRPSDNRTLGIPDVLGWIPVDQGMEGQESIVHCPIVWSIAIEAKQLHPLMDDPFHKGRRTGQMLKHDFSGPQISLLRELKSAGVDACGLVRASEDTAFRFEPEDIPRKTGNFTHEEMVKLGYPVRRYDGKWEFWRSK